MVRVDYEVAIRRPPEDVFAYITRVEEFIERQIRKAAAIDVPNLGERLERDEA